MICFSFIKQLYLREFSYTAEVESTTNTITFTLSNFDKPLSFNLDVFSSIIGLKYTENFSPLPQKETMRAALATLGLVDENNPKISSTDLLNSSPLLISDIEDIDIAGILSDLVTKLTTRKRELRTISILVAKISEQPEKPLILPSEEVNVDTTLINTSKIVKESSPKEQISDTQLAEETLATTDTTLSLVATESAEEQENQLKLIDAEKEEVREPVIKSLGDAPLNEFRGADANLDADKSPFDTK
ncbi:hypothetical protein Tco_0443141 [Tanacetum coccineum]